LKQACKIKHTYLKLAFLTVEGWKGALEDKLNTKEAQEYFKNDLINKVPSSLGELGNQTTKLVEYW